MTSKHILSAMIGTLLPAIWVAQTRSLISQFFGSQLSYDFNFLRDQATIFPERKTKTKKERIDTQTDDRQYNYNINK